MADNTRDTALLHADNLGISFGADALLDGANFTIQVGERIALVGRNGAGKSTLLKILAGNVTPDSGQLVKRQGLAVATLRQDVPQDIHGVVEDIVAQGASTAGALLADYQAETRALAQGGGSSDRLAALQSQIDAVDGWRLAQRVGEILSRMELDGSLDFATLSGGMKRRVLLAQALLANPDILLLDEPTNHLDIAAISWLESHLMSLRCALVFITHDRAFLDRLATRILELDRGQITDWPGDYAQYQRARQAQLDDEERHNALFDKKLAQEERWIRQGIKARRTRNEGRVRALKALRQERSERRERSGNASFKVNAAEASGKVVIEAEGLNYAIEGKTLLRDFSLVLQRGDRVGLVGPNGVGKSTLVKLLLGRITPDAGQVKLGTRLEIAYFDQLREQLDPERSAIDNVSDGKEFVEIGKERKHIMGYMQDFLFSPARARAPITALSGGETNRLMLARLFLKPSNLLVLDEPTNDLDIETLELLESLLAEYPGTVLLISHDRAFINNTVSSTLVFRGAGRVDEFVGGVDDLPDAIIVSLKSGELLGGGSVASTAAEPVAAAAPAAATADKAKPQNKAKSRLTYGEEIELEKLPAQIESLEEELAGLDARLGDPALYNDNEEARRVTAAATTLRDTLAEHYARWEALELKRDGG